MDEQCKDCIYIDTLVKDINEMKLRVGTLEGEVNSVKQTVAINQEQTKMVFKILEEIKDSITKIANKIDDIETRPSKLLYSVGGGLIVGAGVLLINLISK